MKPFNLKHAPHIYITLFSLIFFGLVFGSAEIWTRRKHLYISKLELYAPPSNFEAQVRHLWGEQIFEGDALLGWKLIPGLKEVFWDFSNITTNRQGLRYPEDINKKEKGEFRILALGDSVTFGYRVPVAFPQNPQEYVKSQLSYPPLLEAALEPAFPGRLVRVIPMAVPGYTTYQGLNWLKKDIAKYRPDIITIMYGWNDQELHPLSDKEAIPDDPVRVLARKIVSSSQFLIYFSRWIYSGQEAENSPPMLPVIPRVSAGDYTQNILAMVELAKKYGAKSVIIGPVYQDLESNMGQGKNVMAYRTALREAAAVAGVNYLEIPEMTERGVPNNAELFQEPIHPNFRGHALIVQHLIRYLSDNGLLKSDTR